MFECLFDLNPCPPVVHLTIVVVVISTMVYGFALGSCVGHRRRQQRINTTMPNGKQASIREPVRQQSQRVFVPLSPQRKFIQTKFPQKPIPQKRDIEALKTVANKWQRAVNKEIRSTEESLAESSSSTLASSTLASSTLASSSSTSESFELQQPRSVGTKSNPNTGTSKVESTRSSGGSPVCSPENIRTPISSSTNLDSKTNREFTTFGRSKTNDQTYEAFDVVDDDRNWVTVPFQVHNNLSQKVDSVVDIPEKEEKYFQRTEQPKTLELKSGEIGKQALISSSSSESSLDATNPFYYYNKRQNSLLKRQVSKFEFTRKLIRIDRNEDYIPDSWFVFEAQMNVYREMGSESEYFTCEKITLNWSPTCEVIWTSGKKLLKSAKSGDTLVDICDLMYKRALNNYGISEGYIPEDESLMKLWKWIKFIRNLDETFFKGSKINNGLVGIHNIFLGKPVQSKEEFVKWFSDRNDISSKFASYKSEERNKALFLCEWKSDLDMETGPERLIQKLLSDGKYTRAAAICIFNFSLEKAMECLTEGGASMKGGDDTTLSAVAMALSGYTGVRNQRWCEMCKNMRSKFTDPYLKAMFYFLTSEPSNYKEILNDDKLHLSDRVAFACKFLADQKLQKFLNSLTQSLVDGGDLEGLLLVGLSSKGIDLLQRYVEATSDVQTVSLIILNSLPATHDDPRVQLWVDKYRELLDCWCLWHKRALFDIEWYKRLPSKSSPPQQLFVSCNFCGQSVSSNFRLIGNTKSVIQRSSYEQQQPFGRVSVSAATNKTRIQSCPGCRKPLPRCALCLTQLGTPAGVYWRSKKSEEEIERKLSPFPNWFTFCQTCRHGGHANHLIDWFKEHIECPVSGCNCKCMSLDPKTCDLSERN